MNKLREELHLQWRGVKLSRQLCGRYFILSSTLSDMLPQVAAYVSAYYSGRVITALSENAPFGIVFRYALIAVLSVFAIGFIRQIANRRLRILRQSSFHLREVMFTRKAMSVDFAQAESAEFSDLLGRVEDNSFNYLGIAQQGTQISLILSNLVSVLIALSMSSGMVLGHAEGELHGILKLANSPLFGALFAAFVLGLILLSILSADAQIKRQFKAHEQYGKVRALLKYYYDRILNENGCGEDIRIYHEKPLILEELHTFVIRVERQIWSVMLRAVSTFGMVRVAVNALLGGAVYIFVGLKALAGAFGAGKVVEYYMVLTNMIMAFSVLSREIGRMRSNRVHLVEDLEFFDIQSKMHNGTRTVEGIDPETVEFEFHDVSFRYPDTEPLVLDHLSLTLRHGERLAVVGRNGSGKSTMIKLLCRLYDPDEGCITVNGIDIREFDYEEYLKLFGVVFQDFHLLSFSVAENVACTSEYDAEKVWQCLEMAGLRERVEQMPNKLNQNVTQLYDKDGVDLSGGEAQKLAIARALYKDAPFVILDEPTAALDPKSESEIYARFNDMTGGRTAVYISHRMSSCRFCDRIVVFSGGKIVEQGTHDTLLGKNGEYAALWNAQAQHYAE